MTFERNFWSEQELADFRSLWFTPGESNATIALAMGRTAGAIRNKSVKLGLGPKPKRTADTPSRRDSWTADREKVEFARKLYMDQGMGAGAVAKIMGFPTRGPIVGIAHRLGWKRPQATNPDGVSAGPKQPRTPKATKTVRRFKVLSNNQVYAEPTARPVRALAKETAFELAGNPQARPWEERKPHSCAWPLDGPEGLTWSCCAPSGDETYCADHLKLRKAPPMFTKAQRARLDRAA